MIKGFSNYRKSDKEGVNCTSCVCVHVENIPIANYEYKKQFYCTLPIPFMRVAKNKICNEHESKTSPQPERGKRK